MNIQIRVATPDDVGPLRTLMKELVAFMHEKFVEKRIIVMKIQYKVKLINRRLLALFEI